MLNFFKSKYQELPALKLEFHPESNLTDLYAAVTDYQDIWRNDGEKIISALEKFSTLSFSEDWINALVCDRRRSQSHPLLLGATLDSEGKKCTLVHELGHRIMYQKRNLSFVNDMGNSHETHVHLDLFLYDAWVEIYGKEFADRCVEMERKINLVDDKVYGPAWDKVLAMSFEERQAEVNKIFSKTNA